MQIMRSIVKIFSKNSFVWQKIIFKFYPHLTVYLVTAISIAISYIPLTPTQWQTIYLYFYMGLSTVIWFPYILSYIWSEWLGCCRWRQRSNRVSKSQCDRHRCEYKPQATLHLWWQWLWRKPPPCSPSPTPLPTLWVP